MYTTKQRNKIYKKALKLFNKPNFLCNALNTAIGVPHLTYGCYELFKMLPEFEMFEHRLIRSVWNFEDKYWDDKFPQDCRQTILSLCIAMTEE